MRELLTLGGLAPFSTVDYPGALAAVVFCQGCAWRCPYCHNAHLQAGPGQGPPWSRVLEWLGTRRGLLEAVVFSGGEPTLQPGLPEALGQVRALGFRVGLHTAGCAPGALGEVLPRVDWVGLDIKAPRAEYDRITGQTGSSALAWESLRAIQAQGVPHQVRTTVHPELLSPPAIQQLRQELLGVGEKHLLLQTCRIPGFENDQFEGIRGGSAHGAPPGHV